MDGRFVFLHNTVINWGTIQKFNPEYIVNGYAKNNLIVSYDSGEMWNFGNKKKTWGTDLDYNGFDWGFHTGPFRYDGHTYSDLQSYSDASGLDSNSIVIDRDECFEDLVLNGPRPTYARCRISTVLLSAL